MFCSKITPVFPVIGLIFPSQMYFSLSFIKPCTTFDTDPLPEVAAPSLVPGTFPAAGFQLLVFPQESKLPRQEQNFLSHLMYPHQYLSLSTQSVKASGLIHPNHFWYLYLVRINEILGTVAAMGWDPKACLMAPVPWWSLYWVEVEPVEMLPTILPASLPKVQVL